MMLSIIIPHFNSSLMLQKLLLTIPVANIQVIVVDDCSREEEFKHVVDLKHTHNFELYLNDGTKGAGACRNIGLEKAIGDWVLFSDADDFFMPQMFDVISGFFNTHNDVVYFIPTSVFVDTNQLANRHQAIQERLSAYIDKPNRKNELILRYKVVTPWSKLFNRKFLLENGLKFDEVIASNDVMFSLKAAYAMKRFDVSRSVIYTVTRGKGSLTVNLSREVYESRLNVFIAQDKFLRKVLSKKEYEQLGYSGLAYVVNIWINYGFSMAIETLKTLRQAKVKIIYIGHFHPDFLYNRLLKLFKWIKHDKKYNTLK